MQTKVHTKDLTIERCIGKRMAKRLTKHALSNAKNCLLLSNGDSQSKNTAKLSQYF